MSCRLLKIITSYISIMIQSWWPHDHSNYCDINYYFLLHITVLVLHFLLCPVTGVHFEFSFWVHYWFCCSQDPVLSLSVCVATSPPGRPFFWVDCAAGSLPITSSLHHLYYHLQLSAIYYYIPLSVLHFLLLLWHDTVSSVVCSDGQK